MKRQSFLAAALFALALNGAAAFCQQITVQTEDGKRVFMAGTEIEALPHTKIATDQTVVFEGVELVAVLKKAGVQFGEALRAKRLSLCLLVEASDGYRVVFALPKLDPAFTDKKIVLAFSRNGVFQADSESESGFTWLRRDAKILSAGFMVTISQIAPVS